MASTSPIRGRFEGFKSSIKICCRSHVFELNRNHAIDLMSCVCVCSRISPPSEQEGRNSLPSLADLLPFSNLEAREPTGVIHPGQPPGADSG